MRNFNKERISVSRDNFNDERDTTVNMSCVYASPEVFSASNPENSGDKSYPVFYADFSDEKDTGQIAVEETVRFCMECGRSVPLIATFCPFCGFCIKNSHRNTTKTDSLMGCVYASPVFTQNDEKKRGLFKHHNKGKK